MALLMAAQMFGWITYAQTSESAGAAPPQTTPPLPNSLTAVRQALREFDRFLDHHPLLENQLRLDPRLTTNKAFLVRNSELRDFLRANPSVMAGLQTYPRYFLNRALMRQASAPVSFQDLAPFRDFFQQNQRLEQELTGNPELVRNPEFLDSHAALRDFLVQHPALARVFLPLPVSPGPN